jgi:predicted DNA-binding protein
MGENTSIRLPRTLRDRLNVVISLQAQRTGKSCTQAEWIDKQLKIEEKNYEKHK